MRGGILATEKNKNESFNRILDMGCYKEQSFIGRKCENKSECIMEKIYNSPPVDTYYRCCCDKDYCNKKIIWPVNITTIYETTTSDQWKSPTTRTTSIGDDKRMLYIIIGCALIVFLLVCGLIAFFLLRRQCNKEHARKMLIDPTIRYPETRPFLESIESIQLDPEIPQQRRFCTIHTGRILSSGLRVAVKVLSDNDIQSSTLYKQEKMIYELLNNSPNNILK
ncbi:unnamed protein product [Didymodactylos carnosus]|uniref:Receptor protein serine/threonine kinase n=1 Tax=Didymodactylos carnosus TaxID=1234261 RepID=A0A814JKT5_9BILA|nr:unnamed protein product [Didymodactylos carnosus]CAF3809244.1 unnamed protein product [Didymodactylos carnosus]